MRVILLQVLLITEFLHIVVCKFPLVQVSFVSKLLINIAYTTMIPAICLSGKEDQIRWCKIMRAMLPLYYTKRVYPYIYIYGWIFCNMDSMVMLILTESWMIKICSITGVMFGHIKLLHACRDVCTYDKYFIDIYENMTLDVCIWGAIRQFFMIVSKIM